MPQTSNHEKSSLLISIFKILVTVHIISEGATNEWIINSLGIHVCILFVSYWVAIAAYNENKKTPFWQPEMR